MSTAAPQADEGDVPSHPRGGASRARRDSRLRSRRREAVDDVRGDGAVGTHSTGRRDARAAGLPSHRQVVRATACRRVNNVVQLPSRVPAAAAGRTAEEGRANGPGSGIRPGLRAAAHR